MTSPRVHARHLLTAAAFAGAIAITLAGCAFEPPELAGQPSLTALPEPDPIRSQTTPEPTPVGDAADCGGATVSLNEPGERFALSGDCPLIEVEGADIELDVTTAAVGSLVIRGDRIEIDAGVAGSVSISGQANAVDADELSALEIRGDRNRVEVARALEAVAIYGNDNTAVAESVGETSVSGDRNDVRPR